MWFCTVQQSGFILEEDVGSIAVVSFDNSLLKQACVKAKYQPSQDISNDITQRSLSQQNCLGTEQEVNTSRPIFYWLNKQDMFVSPALSIAVNGYCLWLILLCITTAAADRSWGCFRQRVHACICSISAPMIYSVAFWVKFKFWYHPMLQEK